MSNPCVAQRWILGDFWQKNLNFTVKDPGLTLHEKCIVKSELESSKSHL